MVFGRRWVSRLFSIAAFAALALSCSGDSPEPDDEPKDEEPAVCTAPEPAPPPPCPDGWFHHTDTACPYPPGTPCYEIGDGLCYRPCASGTDCVDPCKPDCVELILCRGSDACFERVSVCQATSPSSP